MKDFAEPSSTRRDEVNERPAAAASCGASRRDNACVQDACKLGRRDSLLKFAGFPADVGLIYKHRSVPHKKIRTRAGFSWLLTSPLRASAATG